MRSKKIRIASKLPLYGYDFKFVMPDEQEAASNAEDVILAAARQIGIDLGAKHAGELNVKKD